METDRTRFESRRFELLRQLGAGGMGTVFEAQDSVSGALLAVKFLNDTTGTALLRFKNEFRALAELAHPNVVRFGELYEERGCFYFTMELVRGENFLDYVRPGSKRHRSFGQVTATEPSPLIVAAGERYVEEPSLLEEPALHDGVLDIARLRGALAQLCSGLIALHAADLVHRDVKPANVLVTNEGKLVLLDFGLAASNSELRVAAPEVAGTFAYMAPEQARGWRVTAAADWYAVGAVLCEALTGRLPQDFLPGGFFHGSAETVPRSAFAEELPEDLCALCRELLRADPTRRPDDETIAHFLGTEAGRERARASFRSRLHFRQGTFVGRDRELGLLHEALRGVQGGACAVARIEGTSGMGKSALMRRFVEQVAALIPEVLVLSGRCHAQESVPYRGIDGIIDGLQKRLSASRDAGRMLTIPPSARILAEAFPVLAALPEFRSDAPGLARDVDPPEARRLVFTGLGDLLAALGREGRVLIHLDDAQWIDPESVALFAFLLRSDLPQTLMVFAHRSGPLDPIADVLSEARAAVHIELVALSGDESVELVAVLSEQRAHTSLEQMTSVAKKSGGHPLFIHELMLHGPTPVESAPSLEEAVTARIDALDPACRGLLRVVALAATSLSHRVIQAAAGLDVEIYPWMLSSLRAENLVSFRSLATNGEVQPYHDRIRELVIEQLDSSARREIHLAIATALEQDDAEDLEALAHHFSSAGALENAARYACPAAERALRQLAFEHAAGLFELAFRCEKRPERRAELAARLGLSLANAGRGADAASAYLRAAALAAEGDALELRRRAGEQLLRAGHLKRGTNILFSMLGDLGISVPSSDFQALCALVLTLGKLRFNKLQLKPPSAALDSRQRLRLDACWTVGTGLSIVHHIRATDFLGRTLLYALEAGERERALRAAAVLAASLSMADGSARALATRLMAFARELADQAPSEENEAWLTLTSGASKLGDWDFVGCEEACRRAELTFSEAWRGAAWEVVTCQAFALWSMAFRGNLVGAAARVPERSASALARGDRHALATLVLSPLHLVGLGADRPEQVRLECQQILADWPADVACFQHMCGHYILAQVDLYEQKVESAWKNVALAWQMLRRGHMSRVQFQRIDLLSLRGRAALACARLPAERERRSWLANARADSRALAREAIAPAIAMSALIDAGIAQLESEPKRAMRCLETSAGEFERLGMRLHVELVRLAQALLASDASEVANANAALITLGASNPTKMLRVWAPSFAPAATA